MCNVIKPKSSADNYIDVFALSVPGFLVVLSTQKP